MTENFPRVVDEESVTARLKRVERSVRALRRLILATAVALAAVGIAGATYVQITSDIRQDRFCATARQAIIASTPASPVDPFLVTLHVESNCAPLPPDVQPHVQSSTR